MLPQPSLYNIGIGDVTLVILSYRW